MGIFDCRYSDEANASIFGTELDASTDGQQNRLTSGIERPHEVNCAPRCRRSKTKSLLYVHALIALIIPCAGVVAALAISCRSGVGLMEVSLLTVMFIVTGGGISVAYHRHLTHKAFKAHPIVRAVIIICGCMAAQGPPIYWAAVHRHHHAHSDEVEDPHSPHRFGNGAPNLLRGLWYAHAGWMFDHPVIKVSFYVRDLLDDSLVRSINNLYYFWIVLGLVVPTAAGGAITGTAFGCVQGFLWGGLVRLFLVHHFTWSVNSLCHVLGTRPFPNKDGSANNAWLAIPTMGESWHNNHHAFPYSAIFAFHPAEIDLGGLYIRLLEVCGLAWDVKEPTVAAIERKRTGVDVPCL